jgi:class 3 adenylate cyclase/tetratricopeptide (TPR) repeat protein
VGGKGDGAQRESRKKITAVFADLAGSTALAEGLDPEIFRQVVSAFFERMAKAIERHGGTVENFIGDEVAGIFGVPVAYGDDALRAVRAAIDMVSEVESLSDEIETKVGRRLSLRIGINTGTVVVGPPIVGRSMSLGDTMNVAARLEKLAQPGQILVGEDTYQLVRRDVEVEQAGELEIRGRGEPMRTFLVRGEVQEPVGEPLTDRPMVGRERELSLLAVAFERSVARGACEFVTVMGDAGMGKSRLVAEVVERYRTRASVLVGRCLPYGDGITYWPLVEIVSQAAGIEDSDDGDEARAKLRRILADDPEGEALTRHLAQIVGLDDSFEPGEQAFWAVRRLCEAIARRSPLVVLLEDLQWAEPTLLDLIVHLHRSLRALPILIVATARFDLLGRRPEWREECPTTISLDALTKDSVDSLVTTLTGTGLSERLRGQIVDLAAGNPLFVEQVLSMLIDDGWLARTEAGWIPRPGADEVRVPPSTEAILAARIDHLPHSERAVLECASVIGKEFAADDVIQLAGEGDPADFESLIRKRLIEPVRRNGTPQAFFQFRHILVRDAVYESLSKAGRAAIHERFADLLLEGDESRRGQIEEHIGYHLEQAHRWRRELLGPPERSEDLARRAANHLANAGRRASARQDDAGAAGLLTRAVALLADSGATDPSARLEPLVELGMALVRNGETDRADQVLAEARRAVVSAGDQLSEARMRLLEVNLKRLTDPPWWAEHGRAVAEGALAVFHELGEELDEARAWHLLGKVHSDHGQQAAAAESLERALELVSRAGDPGIEAWVRYWLLQVQTLGPTPCQKVIATARTDLEWARAHDNRALEGSILGRLGEVLARADRPREAAAAFVDARRVFEELDLPVHVAYLALSTAIVEPLASDPEGAERELRPAVDYFESVGARHIAASLIPMLASAVIAQGRADEGIEMTMRTEEIAASDDLDAQVKWRIARAEGMVALDRMPDAERFARQAVEVAEPADMIVLEADALSCLGDVLLAARSPSEAVPVLERAVSLYDQKGDVVSAAKRRATLDALARTRFL